MVINGSLNVEYEVTTNNVSTGKLSMLTQNYLF